jgi:hypothetical protein
MFLKNRLITISVTILFKLAIAPAVYADTLYLADIALLPEQLTFFIRATNPGITDKQLQARIDAYVEEVEKVQQGLEGAATGTSGMGKWYYGIVRDYHVGPRSGDPTDINNHDAIVFQPLHQDGSPSRENDLVISASLLKFIFHAFDSNDDFKWQFSNRHELLGVPFGSERHRTSIFALFDPDGMMGLGTGEDFSWREPVVEGQLTKIITEGLPSMESMMQRSMWTLKDPTEFPLPTMQLNQVSKATVDLVLAMARAGQYPQVSSSIADQARAGLSLLCSFVLADPEFAAGSLRDAAFRAQQQGLGCHWGLQIFLKSDVDMNETMVGSPQYFDILPVEPSRYREIVLEFMASDDVFKWFSTFDSTDRGAQWRVFPDGVMPDDPVSYGQIALAEIAYGDRAEDVGTRRQELALQALRRMMAKDPEDDAATQAQYELDRRTYRIGLMNWAGQNEQFGFSYHVSDKSLWVYEQFCSIGWGHEEDMKDKALGALYSIWDIYGAQYDGEELPGAEESDLIGNAGLLARIFKSAGRDQHEQALLRLVEDELASYREGIGESERIQFQSASYEALIASQMGSVCLD